MNTLSNTTIRILAIDPTTGGFGFAVMESADELIDWGVRSASAIDKNATTLELISELIERYQPEIIVLQDCRQGKWRRCERVRDLLWEVSRLALREKISVRLISRPRMKATFAGMGARTKHEIASAIAKHLPELAPRQPRYRQPWMPEDYNMAIFDAVALALTFYEVRAARRKNSLSALGINNHVQQQESEDISD
jgi:Holliday junction resolvasome RuvABC endonuclease subunit